MTDNKIGPHLRPITEHRPQERPAGKAPAGTQDFSKRLELAMNELESAAREDAPQATAGDASSIKAAAAAEQEKFESVMRAKQQLSQAYLDITQKPAQDKE